MPAYMRVTAGGTCEIFLFLLALAHSEEAWQQQAVHLSIGLGKKILLITSLTSAHSDLCNFSEPGSRSLVKDKPTNALARVTRLSFFETAVSLDSGAPRTFGLAWSIECSPHTGGRAE